MPKSIDTLLEDVDKLFDGVEISDELADEFGRRMAELVKSRFSAYKEERPPTLRMSMIGHEDRKIWYHCNGSPKEELTSQQKRRFLWGDFIEEIMIFFAKAAGHEVTEEQGEVVVEGIKGHKDCKIDGVLVDIKSASTFGFRKFKDNTIVRDNPYGYLHQISGYGYEEKRPAYFWAMDKQHTEMALSKIEYEDMVDPAPRIKELKVLITEPEPPEKCYMPVAEGKSGNLALSTSCTYCDYKEHCWSHANNGQGLRKFKYSTGVKYLTHVEKEPNVEEVV